jgi:fucose permease
MSTQVRAKRADPSASQGLDPDRRHAVLSVYATSFLMGAISMTLPASSVVLREALGLGDTLYGSLFLMIYGVGMVVSLSNAWILKRWSLRRLFLTGLGLQVATLLLMAASPGLARWNPAGYGALMLGAALFGVGAGASGITINTAAMEIFPRSRSGALAALHGSLGVGAALWPLVVAVLARARLWPLAPLLLSGVAAGLTLMARRRPIRGLQHELVADHGRRDVPGRLWGWSLAILLYGAAESALTAWVVIYLTEDRGASMAVGAGALTAFWLSQTAGRFAMTFVTRRLHPARVAPVLILAMVFVFPLVADCPGDARAYLVYALAGLACSGIFPLLLGLATDETPRRAPLVTALFSAAVVLGLAVGGFGLGPLRSLLPLQAMYRSLSVAAALTLVLVLFLLRGHLRAVAR